MHGEEGAAAAGIVSGCRGVGVRNAAHMWTMPVLRAQPPKRRRPSSQHRNGPPFRLALAPCRQRAYNRIFQRGAGQWPVPLCAVKGPCPLPKRARVRLIMRQDVATEREPLRQIGRGAGGRPPGHGYATARWTAVSPAPAPAPAAVAWLPDGAVSGAPVAVPGVFCWWVS